MLGTCRLLKTGNFAHNSLAQIGQHKMIVFCILFYILFDEQEAAKARINVQVN